MDRGRPRTRTPSTKTSTICLSSVLKLDCVGGEFGGTRRECGEIRNVQYFLNVIFRKVAKLREYVIFQRKEFANPRGECRLGLVKTVVDKEELLGVLAGVDRENMVLVPTMGAFHEGHLSLIRKARKTVGDEGTVIVSIFVNPIQFDRQDDLDRYPKTTDRDKKWCRDLRVDVVFLPLPEGMYHRDHSTLISESSLSKTLCGKKRPGHFDGVCTVVLKLFLLTGCRFAIFGEKDFQQLAIVRRMVRDLDVPIKILIGETVRERDGLAMSSRNARLDSSQRKDAANIRRFLQDAAAQDGALEIVKSGLRENLEASGMARVDYVEIVNPETLKAVTERVGGEIIAVAVFYGDVRLIDHISTNFAP